jgi:hypothetical protein
MVEDLLEEALRLIVSLVSTHPTKRGTPAARMSA